MVYPCLRCGSSTIGWEIQECGTASLGRKCFACGKFFLEEEILKAQELAYKLAQNGVNKVVDQEKTKTEAPRICKKCGKNPTINKHSPFCSPCMRQLANEARERKKAASLDDKKAKGQGALTSQGETPLKEKESSRSEINAITIDFGAHAGLLREIEKLAEEEIRPVGLQIIYILKNHLKATQTH